MKYFILFLLSMLIVNTTIYAQRMMPKQKGLEINTGLLLSAEKEQFYSVGLVLTSYFNRGNYWLWGVAYHRIPKPYKNLQVPIESFLAETGYSLRLTGDLRKRFNLNASITGVGGYETVNRGKEILPDGAIIKSKSGFVYGAGGKLSLETFFSDGFVLLVHAELKALWGTSIYQLRPGTGLGLRFNF
jgi:hypothetical protein